MSEIILPSNNSNIKQKKHGIFVLLYMPIEFEFS